MKALAVCLFAASIFAADLPIAEVYKSPYCGCCGEWEKSLKEAGFVVNGHRVEDVSALRESLGIPEKYASCHTAKIGGYLIEGHVPAEDIKRLLSEKPEAIALAAPGMPQGSPGMETGVTEDYDTILIFSDGSSRLFARHLAR
jgi:hypothetical protein